MLTPGQVENFREQGFLVLEAVLEAESLESLRCAAAKIVAGFDIDRHRSVFSTADSDRGRDQYFFDSAEAVHCFLEEEALDADGRLLKPKELAINKIGHALHDRVPAFTQFCRQALFGQLLRQLGYRAPQLWQTMYIFKQPGIGGEVRWHQDASYLISEPRSVCGIWVALEDAHRDNACLWLQPGGHRSPLREIYQVDPTTRQGRLLSLDSTAWPSPDDAVAAEVPAGSLVLFDSMMPHYSAPNRSAVSRQAFTLHVAESDSRWSPQNWLQRPTLPPFTL